MGTNQGSRVQMTQIMGINTQKVIQSVKLHILHQMKPYLNTNTILVLIDTYFSVFGALGQIMEIGTKHPKSWACHSKCQTSHFTSGEALLKDKGNLRVN